MREYEVSGRVMMVEERQPFYEYVREKLKVERPLEFLQTLKKDDREKIFLKWRWGFSDETTNKRLEQTRIALLKSLQPSPDPYVQEYINLLLLWESKCNQYRQELGLYPAFIPSLTPDNGISLSEPSGEEFSENE